MKKIKTTTRNSAREFLKEYFKEYNFYPEKITDKLIKGLVHILLADSTYTKETIINALFYKKLTKEEIGKLKAL